jgi:hypothetical protein
MAQSIYPYVGEEGLEPVPLPQAFDRRGEVAAQSQAALLLVLGQLLGDAEEEPEKALTVQADEASPQEDWDALQLPARLRKLEQARPMRLRSGLLRERFGRERVGRAIETRVLRSEAAIEDLSRMQREVADELLDEPSPEAAAELVEASLNHPQPLVRVSAAAAATDILIDEEAEQAEPISILEEGAASEDELVRGVARTALARAVPDHPLLARLERPGEPPLDGATAHTVLLVHGTFARQGSWWQPGGDFHSYLLGEAGLSVYAAADRYDWSGGYSNAARSLAASQLGTWVSDHGLGGLDLFCHSHGGSVAMEASQNGLDLGQLVLLACPVHRNRYWPDFALINEVLSIRVRFDLVILADRGGQRFRDPQIREIVLPIWFNHSATHDPDVWRRHDLPSQL